jgi:hypothetical protein
LLWNNGGENAIVGSATLTLTYSLFETGESAGSGGDHNQALTTSPFTNATGPDLLLCSPAIDAGNDGANSTATDVLGNDRKVRTIDIGAAEYLGAASTLSVTAQATPNSVCVGSSTSLQAIVSGSTGPYSYTWTAPSEATLSSTSQNPTSTTPTTAGTLTFSIRVTDNIGCEATNTVSVIANALPTTYNVTGGGAYCAGGNGTDVGLSSSQTGVNYQLFRDNNAVGNAVAGTGNALSFGNQTATGAYTVQATTTTGSCQQTMTGSVTVSITQLPNVSLSNSGPITCTSPMVSLSAMGGGTYSFSPGANQVAGGNTATVTAEGSYTVTVTSNGCSATAATSVTSSTVTPQNVTLSSSGTLSCANISVNLIAASTTQALVIILPDQV